MELAVRRQQEELEREQARVKKLKELKSTGVRIAPDDWIQAGGYCVGPGFSIPMESEEHAGEPCHAATVNAAGEVIYLCMEPARHRPSPPAAADASDRDESRPEVRPSLSVVPAPALTPEQEAAEAAFREQEAARRAEEEAQRAAEQARLEALQTAAEGRAVALKTLLAGRLGKAEVTRQFLGWFLLRTVHDSYFDDTFVCQVLSLEQPDNEGDDAASWPVLEYAGQNKDSLQRAAVAVACHMAEAQLQGEFPNFESPVVHLYYDYLARTGAYELSDIERAELLAADAEIPEASEPTGEKEEVTA
jgi:hypothetical protein